MARRAVDDGWSGSMLGPAGWLFAELALVLLVIVLGSESVTVPAGPAVAGTATTTTATGQPQPPPVEGLSLRTMTFVMPAVTEAARAVEVFTRLLNETVGSDARVGLVLLFGVSRTGALADGAAVSKRLKGFIEPAHIPQLRSAVDIRPYLGGPTDGRPGEVLVELFLLNGPP